MSCNIKSASFSYTGSFSTYIFYPGTYQIELWGAQGGGKCGGKGGYTSGIISFSKKTTGYIYVGGQGSLTEGGYNGGGDGGKGTNDPKGIPTPDGGGGGGSTDVRVKTNSIYSRIIVAGGGGGACGDDWSPGGNGGGLTGDSAEINVNAQTSANGGSQTNGDLLDGKDAPNSISSSYGSEGNGGGGGGYRGGFASTKTGLGSNAGGGGGSSYISGYSSCIKYLDYTFTSCSMLKGEQSGNGKASITVLCLDNVFYDKLTCQSLDFNLNIKQLIFVFVLIK